MFMNRTRLECVAAIVAGLAVGHLEADENQVLKTDTDKTSYCIGVDMARNFKRQGIRVDLEQVMRGYRDADAGTRLLLPEPELDEIRKVYMAEAMRKQAMSRRTPGQENKEKGDAFLAENKTKEGVVCLPDGLQYQIIKAGTGPKPTESDTVECHYRGIQLDGKEFVGTSPNKPATLKVTEAMVPALVEALTLMPVGSKWKLFVPPQLGFGVRGVGKAVGPNETLIFEVELVGIK